MITKAAENYMDYNDTEGGVDSNDGDNSDLLLGDSIIVVCLRLGSTINDHALGHCPLQGKVLQVKASGEEVAGDVNMGPAVLT